MRLGALGLAIGSLYLGDHERVTAVPRSIIAGIGPDLAGLRLLASGFEHGRGGLIGEQSIGSSQSLEDMIAHGVQIPCRLANPAYKGGAIQLDALPGIDLCRASMLSGSGNPRWRRSLR